MQQPDTAALHTRSGRHLRAWLSGCGTDAIPEDHLCRMSDAFLLPLRGTDLPRRTTAAPERNFTGRFFGKILQPSYPQYVRPAAAESPTTTDRLRDTMRARYLGQLTERAACLAREARCAATP